jgi:hypothetical protein
MAAARQFEYRVLGYVQLKVASRTFRLPVAALPESPDAAGVKKPGFFAWNGNTLGIFVDDDASDSEKRATIEQGSLEAARHIAQKIFN